MNYAPIGAHGPWCDDGEWLRMCDSCRAAAEWDTDPHEEDQ